MSGWIAALAFAPATLLSGVAVIRAFMNARQIKQNSHAIQQVHVIVNDRLTKLLETSGALARAEGRIEGRDTERNEEAERDRMAEI